MSEDSVGAIDRDFARLDEGACFEIDVTGHKLYVRREQGELIGVRHKPGQTIVEPHEKDEEFVRRMMGWKGYREVPRDEPPFDYETEEAADELEGEQQRIMTDGGRDQFGVGLARTLAKVQHHHNAAMEALADHDDRRCNYELLQAYFALEDYLMEDEDDGE